ncbi:MAG: hypothetical protein R2991_09705 [Thermoanaerobaculia bacterium]
MSGDWGLVIAVLGLGLGVGALLVWRLGRGGGGGAAGRELELADLERRQEELYERLRTARAEGDADEARELEDQAAVNLRNIERLRATVPATARRAPDESAPGAATALPDIGRAAGARHGVTGFVAGLLVAGLVGLLIYWAQTDRGRPGTPGATPSMQGGGDHPEGAELSADDQARLEQLRQAVEGNPEDLSARKRYALGLLGTGQFFHAFEQAQEIRLRRRRIRTVSTRPPWSGRRWGDEVPPSVLRRRLSNSQHVLALTGKYAVGPATSWVPGRSGSRR